VAASDIFLYLLRGAQALRSRYCTAGRSALCAPL